MNLLHYARDLLWPIGRGEPLQHVHQLEPNSCGVACLGMVLGVDYWEARARVPAFDPEQGLLMGDILRVLAENGWAYQEKWPDYSPARCRRPFWPLQPWAPLHLCAVRSTGWHCVVLLQDGTVLDPLHAPRRLFAYKEVYQMVGLWRVA